MTAPSYPTLSHNSTVRFSYKVLSIYFSVEFTKMYFVIQFILWSVHCILYCISRVRFLSFVSHDIKIKAEIWQKVFYVAMSTETPFTKTTFFDKDNDSLKNCNFNVTGLNLELFQYVLDLCGQNLKRSVLVWCESVCGITWLIIWQGSGAQDQRSPPGGATWPPCWSSSSSSS